MNTETKIEMSAWVLKWKKYLDMELPEDEKEWIRNALAFWEHKLQETKCDDTLETK